MFNVVSHVEPKYILIARADLRLSMNGLTGDFAFLQKKPHEIGNSNSPTGYKSTKLKLEIRNIIHFTGLLHRRYI